MALRVGIVGWGDIAQRHAHCLRRAGALVRGVVSRRCAPSVGIERFETLETLLPHVDAVTVAVPNHLHAECCLQAVRARRAVLVEKPLLISNAELLELEKALPEANAPVYVGYRLRWNPQLRRLRESRLRPRRITCSFQLGIERLAAGKEWTRDVRQSGGAFFTLDCHMLDLARWLSRSADRPIEALTAHADCTDAGTGYPLRVTLSGRLGDNVAVTATGDTRDNRPYRIDVRVEHETEASPAVLRLDASSEPIEYEAMIREFVASTLAGRIDRAAVNDTLQLHRELLLARDLAAQTRASRPSRRPGSILR